MEMLQILEFALDIIFALIMAALIVGFVYLRERKLRDEFVNSLVQPSEGKEVAPENTEVATNSKLPATQRAEKYLEAVALYRQGIDRKEIEKRVGISLMELELLGQTA